LQFAQRRTVRSGAKAAFVSDIMRQCAAPPCSRRVNRFTCMVRIKPALSTIKSAVLALATRRDNIHQRVVARFATVKLRASLSQCAGCRQLRVAVLVRQLAAPFRPPDMYYRSRGGKCDGGFTPESMQAK
jgi:hypothetical protein